ncbi:MAG: peptide chain release factor 3 [Chitinophagales bacterium]|nr:peptide chain release factor 3 [Chitinophagales bacterium]MDW8393363.1 peptide chain release factor 3 [Chitinophagales bacterium]
MNVQAEISRRRTFAIISHPDAGKTTLTEKFLLYGGAIQVAGAVKSNKIRKTATSDFMEIERQRGISVATSVLTFSYSGYLINLLDTPGHRDFAEDTYRTLTAVDSVILVIDSVKGVETQTEKLMQVCRMRHTPVIIFINKMDLEGKNPFDLLDECERLLNIHVHPLSFPINKGQQFKGVFNLFDHSLQLFTPDKQRVEAERLVFDDLSHPAIEHLIGFADAAELRESVDLLQGVYGPFDRQRYLQGAVAPVFFGSARNNFGVKELLETFLTLAPAPSGRQALQRFVEPTEPAFSGMVFKIHANIDPRHRNRIAFVRVVSGRFERHAMYYHCRLNKHLRFSNPYTFLAASKQVVEEAWPGDVVGLPDTGLFRIGDTLTAGEPLQFTGIPSFSPEIFQELVNRDPLKSKQLEKGIQQLTEEGVAQLFYHSSSGRRLVGTVGELQFEVIRYRLEHEYGASCQFIPRNYYKACWITGTDAGAVQEFIRLRSQDVFYDKEGHAVYMAPSEWMLNNVKETNPRLMFHHTSEFKTRGEGFAEPVNHLRA